MSTFVIAEAGVNHNGDPALALELVTAAHRAGADAVKFQTFRPEALVRRDAPKAGYQQASTGSDEGQFAMLRKLVLDEAAHHRVAERCRALGIQFLSTPFDLASLAMLVADFDLPLVKVPSGEITNGPLLLAAARTGRDVILSTGMSTLDDIRDALAVLAFGYTRGDQAPSAAGFAAAFDTAGKAALADCVTLLQCTTEYPAPFEDVNLKAMDTLHQAFGLKVGLSDHTVGIAAPIAAVARGATVVEKHFTLDRSMPGPDHAASLEPGELALMVQAIRQVEAMLGNGAKRVMPSEAANALVARKALVAAAPIAAGQVFTEALVTAKRPADGVSPMRHWELMGRRARRGYAADEAVDPAELDG